MSGKILKTGCLASELAKPENAAAILKAVPDASDLVKGISALNQGSASGDPTNAVDALTAFGFNVIANDSTTAGGNALQKAIVNAMEQAIAGDPGAIAAIASALAGKVTANLKNCAGAQHAAGATVPSCAEMTKAIADGIASVPGDKFLQGLQSYNAATNVMTLLMSDGTTVNVDMTAVINDAVASAVAPSAQSMANSIAGDAVAQATLATALGATAAQAIAGDKDDVLLSPSDMSAALQDGAAYPIHVTATAGKPAIKGVQGPGTKAGEFEGDTYTSGGAYHDSRVQVNNDPIAGTGLVLHTFGYIGVGGNDGQRIEFLNNTVSVGSINTTGTGTSYNTNSDYRLKTVDGPVKNSGKFVDSLKPYTGEWKAKPGEKAAFFLAHEVQAVSPSSVTGEKDAVDADGKAVMQSMEYGSADLIVNMVAELQDLRKRVKELEAK
jgi:hypothetical protein